MSVAFELEYEMFQPRLRLVPAASAAPAGPPRAVVVRRRRLLVAAVAAVLLILLMLPIRVLGGASLASAGPVAGQQYIVKGGDTLASIAQRADAANPASMTARLVAETGSTVVVPGERIIIP